MKSIIILLLLTIQTLIFAESIENNSFKTQELQNRYQTLIAEIRCPVCQGQSIGGSNAPLAQDLRKVVANMLKNGDNNHKIFEFMRSRYGDFVIFKPPVNNQTYILWVAPFIFVVFAIFFLTRKKKPATINKINTDKAKNILDNYKDI
jgi:cytochrome c-type biogenesis protein CcmH